LYVEPASECKSLPTTQTFVESKPNNDILNGCDYTIDEGKRGFYHRIQGFCSRPDSSQDHIEEGRFAISESPNTNGIMQRAQTSDGRQFPFFPVLTYFGILMQAALSRARNLA